MSETSEVELGGLEPPSKHRTRQLSTRLFFLWLSATGCRKTGHLKLILYDLTGSQRHYPAHPVWMIPLIPVITGLKPGGILVQPAALADRIELIDLVN